MTTMTTALASPSTRRRAWRPVALGAVLLVLLAWGWFDVRARAMPEEGSPKTDLTVYLEAARAIRGGQDIYAVTNERRWPYLYPPLAALVFVPLADLPTGQAAYAWFVASLGMMVGSVLLVRGALRRFDPDRALPACAWALVPIALPALHTLQRGQVNILVLLAVSASIYLLACRRDFWAGAALAIAGAVKATPGLAGGYFLYKWAQHQVRAARAGRWQPATLFEQTRAPIGFAIGLVLGLYLVPALYMGPRDAAVALTHWRQKVAGGYVTANAAGQVLADTRGIHDTSDRNQSWYRVAFSVVGLAEPASRNDRDTLQPLWQGRLRWILVGLGVGLTALLAWASRADMTRWNRAAACAELAGFVWLAISFGKIAWGHFYVTLYPLVAIAWLVARQPDNPRDGRALRWIVRLMAVACLLHYHVTGGRPPSDRTQFLVPHDLGGLLLPAGVLAMATILAANRQGRGPKTEE